MKCAELNLGGRTVEQPCLGPLGFCSPWDFGTARQQLQAERNGLIARLNAYNNLRANGQAPKEWPPAVSVAYELADGASYQLLQDYPASRWDWLRFDHDLQQATRLMVEMTIRVHAASCDVDAAIAATGAAPPSVPIVPPPPVGLVDSIATGLGRAAEGAGKLVLVGLGAWFGVQILRGRERDRGGDVR